MNNSQSRPNIPLNRPLYGSLSRPQNRQLIIPQNNRSSTKPYYIQNDDRDIVQRNVGDIVCNCQDSFGSQIQIQQEQSVQIEQPIPIERQIQSERVIEIDQSLQDDRGRKIQSERVIEIDQSLQNFRGLQGETGRPGPAGPRGKRGKQGSRDPAKYAIASGLPILNIPQNTPTPVVFTNFSGDISLTPTGAIKIIERGLYTFYYTFHVSAASTTPGLVAWFGQVFVDGIQDTSSSFIAYPNNILAGTETNFSSLICLYIKRSGPETPVVVSAIVKAQDITGVSTSFGITPRVDISFVPTQ